MAAVQSMGHCQLQGLHYLKIISREFQRFSSISIICIIDMSCLGILHGLNVGRVIIPYIVFKKIKLLMFQIRDWSISSQKPDSNRYLTRH